MSSLRPRLLRAPMLLGVAVSVSALLVGCGSEGEDTGTDPGGPPSTSVTSTATSDPTPSTTPSPSTDPVPAGTPDCAEVWQPGAMLPRGYAGCAVEGTFVAPDYLGCSSGQRIARYDDRFYVVGSGVVTEVSDRLLADKQYRAAVVRCRA